MQSCIHGVQANYDKTTWDSSLYPFTVQLFVVTIILIIISTVFKPTCKNFCAESFEKLYSFPRFLANGENKTISFFRISH